MTKDYDLSYKKRLKPMYENAQGIEAIGILVRLGLGSPRCALVRPRRSLKLGATKENSKNLM